MQRDRLLIVDDDASVRHLIRERLTLAGFDVEMACDGLEALEMINRDEPDLVALDLVMPRLDGLDVLRMLRLTHLTPVIMLTGRGDLMDRIEALELGADDYMVKPFSPRELEARIRAILRRGRREEVHRQTLELIPDERQAMRNGKSVPLTEMEYGLLELLAQNPGRPFTRSEILHLVWGYRISHYTDSRVVDVHVARLRAKLESDPALPQVILTAQGTGYLFADAETA